MHQFVIPPDWDGSPSLILTGQQAKYLKDVLRFKKGDHFPGIDTRGQLYELLVEDILQNKVRLQVKNVQGKIENMEKNIPIPITLVQAMPKGSKMDLIIRQAVEGGISRIIPISSSRTIASSSPSQNHILRWKRIAHEAVQQCNNPGLPIIENPIGINHLKDLFEFSSKGELRLFLHEIPLASETIHDYCTILPERIVLCVGPEGGFSSEDILLLENLSFKPVWLGRNILRTETASIFAIGALRMILLEHSTWIQKK